MFRRGRSPRHASRPNRGSLLPHVKPLFLYSLSFPLSFSFYLLEPTFAATRIHYSPKYVNIRWQVQITRNLKGYLGKCYVEDWQDRNCCSYSASRHSVRQQRLCSAPAFVCRMMKLYWISVRKRIYVSLQIR